MLGLFLKLIEISVEAMIVFFGIYFLRITFAKPEDMLPLLLGKKFFGLEDLVQFKKLSKSRILPSRIVSLLFSLSLFYTAFMLFPVLLH